MIHIVGLDVYRPTVVR